MICLTCCQQTKNPKFCSRSCAASYNNRGLRRHGAGPNQCLVCKANTRSSARIYCSRTCAAIHRAAKVGKPDEHKRAINAARQSRYRAKKLRIIAADANKDVIASIYLHRPKGHEVDHIIPLSLGGKHHEDNLQYLPIAENRRKGNRWIG